MTATADHLLPNQRKFRRALAVVWAFLQAMEKSGFDYTLDRIERLEREVGQLKEELRQSRDTGPVDAHNDLGNLLPFGPLLPLTRRQTDREARSGSPRPVRRSNGARDVRRLVPTRTGFADARYFSNKHRFWRCST